MKKEEDEKRLEYLRGIVMRLPNKPGSYQFYDDQHTIIYVGKAKTSSRGFRLTSTQR